MQISKCYYRIINSSITQTYWKGNFFDIIKIENSYDYT